MEEESGHQPGPNLTCFTSSLPETLEAKPDAREGGKISLATNSRGAWVAALEPGLGPPNSLRTVLTTPAHWLEAFLSLC